MSGSYNALNQPVTISSASASVSFGYDPLGRCVKRVSGTTTYLYYDGWNLIQEGSSATSVDRIYVHGNRVDEIVADQAGGVWSYHHYDARGHCILLTDASGNLVEQYSYDAFGKVYYYDGAGNALTDTARGNRFLFTGREWLSTLRLYDYRNRLYLPELGRFIQPDPKEFAAGDYNLYRYCHNDPVNKSDPTGLNWFFSDSLKHWDWHPGTQYHGETSKYTGLLIAKSIGTDSKNGRTNYKLTLYDQNKMVAQGTGFSGGNGNPAIRSGNYKIDTSSRDESGPSSINPRGGNPYPYGGIQKMHDLNSPDGKLTYPVVGAWGEIRAKLHPFSGLDDGDYFHGQSNGYGYTHGCLCYGTDTRFIDHIWNNMHDTMIGVGVNEGINEP